MNAERAREITRINLKGPVIQPVLDYVFGKITKAATEGRNEIVHPFVGIRTTVTPAMEAEVITRLQQEGFKVVDHPDPDPGDPRGGAYTTVSW